MSATGDLNPAELEVATAELGALGSGTVLGVAMDAGKLADVQRLLDDTLSAFGAVHLAVFNAVTTPPIPTKRFPEMF